MACCQLKGEENLRKITILGLVEKPGEYQVSKDQHFLSAILEAGGVSKLCSGRADVRRTSENRIVIHEVNLWTLLSERRDFRLQDNDVVMFPHDDWAPRLVKDPDVVNKQIRSVIVELQKGRAEPVR